MSNLLYPVKKYCSIPIRDSPEPAPTHAAAVTWGRPRTTKGEVERGKSLMGIFPHRI